MENKESLQLLLQKYTKPILLEKVMYIISKSLIPLFILMFLTYLVFTNPNWIDEIIKMETAQTKESLRYVISFICIFLLGSLITVNFYESIKFYKNRSIKYNNYLQNNLYLNEWQKSKEIGQDNAYIIYESENYFYFITTVIGKNISIIKKSDIVSLQLLFTEYRHRMSIHRFFNIKLTTQDPNENIIELETNRDPLGKQEDIDKNKTIRLFTNFAKYAKHVEIDYQKPIRFFDNTDLINEWIQSVSK